MYEYKFVHHQVTYTGGQVEPDYEDVIRAQAADGWRLVQIFNPQPAEATQSLVLIFERQADWVSGDLPEGTDEREPGI